jgi:hypothetical protein
VHENSRFAANDTLDSEGIGDDPQGVTAIPRQKLQLDFLLAGALMVRAMLTPFATYSVALSD